LKIFPVGIILNYLSIQSFDFERTWWRLFQKKPPWALN